MKLKVKVTKDLKVLIDLSENTFRELKLKLATYCRENNLNIDIELSAISLNGKNSLTSADDDLLTSHGIVHGDVLILIPKNTQNPQKMASKKIKTIHAASKYFREDIMETHFSDHQPQNIDQALLLAIHCNFLERGFQLTPSEAKISSFWGSSVSTIQYINKSYPEFSCTLVVVSMGDIKQVMTSFPKQTIEISLKLSIKDFINSNNDISINSIKVNDLSKKIKNELLYPLEVEAHNMLGVPAPWHIAGLPSEIVLHICKFLNVKSVLNLSETCKRLNILLKDDQIWKQLYQKDFSCNVANCDNYTEKYKEAYKEKVEKAKQKKAYEDRRPIPERFPDAPGPFPYPAPTPRGIYNDPDSPYFQGEIPSAIGPRHPGIRGDPNPLGIPSPLNPRYEDIMDPFGQGRRGLGGRNDPFSGPMFPNMRGGGGRHGGGPGFNFF